MTANQNQSGGQKRRAKCKPTGGTAILGERAKLRLDRRAAEEALRANEERLRLALDAARLATWDWDIASGSIMWNDQHYRMLGYEPRAFQPTYKFWSDRVHPDDLPAAEAKIRQTMEQGGEYVNHFRTLWPDGTVRYLEALGRFERDAAGKAVRCYGAMLDVTEHHKAEEEMARLASFPLINPHPIVEIESSPGQGSQFKLIIPQSLARAVAATAPAAGRAQVSVAILPQIQNAHEGEQRKIRVMLVDDHMVMRQGLAALLRGEPDMVIAGEASDGESAVSMALDLRPDVVLMDISMPGMDGIRATRIIHKKIPEIPIIGLSMFVEKEKAAAIKEAGAVNYLEKSGPSEALIAAIRACSRGIKKEVGTM